MRVRVFRNKRTDSNKFNNKPFYCIFCEKTIEYALNEPSQTYSVYRKKLYTAVKYLDYGRGGGGGNLICGNLMCIRRPRCNTGWRGCPLKRCSGSGGRGGGGGTCCAAATSLAKVILPANSAAIK